MIVNVNSFWFTKWWDNLPFRLGWRANDKNSSIKLEHFWKFYSSVRAFLSDASLYGAMIWLMTEITCDSEYRYVIVEWILAINGDKHNATNKIDYFNVPMLPLTHSIQMLISINLCIRLVIVAIFYFLMGAATQKSIKNIIEAKYSFVHPKSHYPLQISCWRFTEEDLERKIDSDGEGVRWPFKLYSDEGYIFACI